VLEGLRLAYDEATTLRGAVNSSVLQDLAAARVRVGTIAQFSSGKSIAVSGLAQEESAECPVPVFGGNGLAGFTMKPLVASPTVVIGRVGQFCGSVLLTTGPAWITDNALMARHVDTRVASEFLALCLEAANLNRRKIGNYLPLINQTVVHDLEIPVPDAEEQAEIVHRSRALSEQVAELRRHLDVAFEAAAVLREAIFTG
jgi:type I restriction enzyme S subunit